VLPDAGALLGVVLPEPNAHLSLVQPAVEGIAIQSSRSDGP